MIATGRPFLRDGIALRLHDGGGDLPPMVFQHGLCGDARQTAEVFPDAAPFRLLTLECRGHGGSGIGDPGALSIATFADDVAAVIEAIGAPVPIGGISMGAAIALRLAVRRPDLVRALVLARPAWVAGAAPANMAPNAAVGDLLASLPRETARRQFVESPVARRLATEAPDNLASLTGFFTRDPQAGTAALLRAISSDGPGVTEDEIRAIAVPTLVIGHSRDAVHPLAYAEALAGLIPAARLVVIAPKADDRARFVADFHTALSGFLGALQ